MADYNVTYDAGAMSIMIDSEQVERALGDLKGKADGKLINQVVAELCK